MQYWSQLRRIDLLSLSSVHSYIYFISGDENNTVVVINESTDLSGTRFSLKRLLILSSECSAATNLIKGQRRGSEFGVLKIYHYNKIVLVSGFLDIGGSHTSIKCHFYR